jgi:hypothetical protein
LLKTDLLKTIRYEINSINHRLAEIDRDYSQFNYSYEFEECIFHNDEAQELYLANLDFEKLYDAVLVDVLVFEDNFNINDLKAYLKTNKEELNRFDNLVEPFEYLLANRKIGGIAYE